MRDDEVKEIVNDLLKELKTSHTALYTPRDLEYWALRSIFSGDLKKFKIPFSGIWATKQDGRWFAKYVIDGSPAQKAGVFSGDQLIAINGLEFTPLGFRKGQNSKLTLSKDGKTNLILDLTPFNASIQDNFLNASIKSENIFIRNQRKIGYFHLWSGTHEAFLNSMNSALKHFKSEKVDSVVIDLREGFGGAYPDYLTTISNDDFYKTIPKVFIINDNVKSGKEWITAIIKRDHLGKIVGSKTAGAFVAGGRFELLNDRYFLYLAVKEFLPKDIPPIEGIGVTPDIEVSPCLKYCGGIDPQLEAAIKEVIK